MLLATARLPVWFVLIAGLLIIGVSPRVTIAAVVVVVVQSSIGLAIVRRVFPDVLISNLTAVGIGFIVGSALWVIPTQLLGSGPRINLAILVILTLIAESSARTDYPVSKFLQGNANLKGLAMLAGLTTLILSNEWPSLTLSSIFFLSAAMIQLEGKTHGKGVRVGFALCIALAIAGLIWTSRRQGLFGWLITDDYSYLEALQVHLADFGIWEDWGPTDISKYHWVSTAWVGQISQLTDAPSFVIATRVATTVFTMSIVSNSLLLFNHWSRNSYTQLPSLRELLALIALFLFVGIDLSATSTFSVFAFGTAFLTLLSKMTKSRKKFGAVLLTVGLLGTTLITKVFWSPFLLATAGLVLIHESSLKRRPKSAVIATVAILLCLGYSAILINLGPNLSNGNYKMWETPSTGTEVFASVLREWPPYLGSLVLPSLVAVIILCRTVEMRTRYEIIISISLLGLSFALVSALFVNPTRWAWDLDNYLIRHAAFFGLFSVVAAIEFVDRIALLRAAIGSVASLLFLEPLGIANKVASHLIGPGQPLSQEMPNLTSWFLPLVAAITVSLSVELKKRPRKELKTSLLTTFLAVLVLTPTLHTVTNRIQSGLRQDTSVFNERSSEFTVSVLGTPALESLGQWIDSNTDKDAVIASNYLCKTNVPGSLFDENYLCTEANTDYTLAHNSRRRFLILGPFFVYENPQRRDYYISVSLRYASTMTAEDRTVLRELGVDYFVLAKTEMTNQPAKALLKQVPGVVLETDQYAIIDLRL